MRNSRVIGIVVLCVVGVFAYLACKRTAENGLGPKPADVTVILKVDAKGAVVKDLYPFQALLYCGHDVSWSIFNGAGRAVEFKLGSFIASERVKEPIDFQTKTINILPRETKSIKGKVKDKTMLDQPPPATSDAIGKYQDFRYTVEVDGQVLDPEVRVRQ
jgi:hypothetical protein